MQAAKQILIYKSLQFLELFQRILWIILVRFRMKIAAMGIWNGKFWSAKGLGVKVIAQRQGHQDGGRLIPGSNSHVRNVHAEAMGQEIGVRTR